MYGPTLADVLLCDGTNVNHKVGEEGWCWCYRKYAPGDMKLEKLEKEARDVKKGLWADPYIGKRAREIPRWTRNRAGRGVGLLVVAAFR